MKGKIKSFVHFIFFISLFFLSYQNVHSQSCVTARWGVDAGLYSGVIEYGGLPEPSTPRSNDWFSGSAGIGIIDETNRVNLQSLLQAPGNPIYETRLKTKGYSIVENQLFIDGLFARDYFGGTGFRDATSFLTASKNGQDPAIWDPGEANVLGKNDIIDAAGFMMRNGTTLESDLFFIGLFNMAEPGGTAYMDFEYYVNSLSYNPASGFSSGGPQLGHTAYQFEPDTSNPGKVRISKIGDFIFSVSLEGQNTNLDTRIWVSREDWLTKISSTFNWTGTFDGAFTGSPYGYAGISPIGPNVLCGIVNPDATSPIAPPWGTKGTKNNSWSDRYLPNSIAEVAINLTALGMDHSSLLGADKCFFPLNTFIVKTRSSASFTAQLKDFSGPYRWGTPTFGAEAFPPVISCDSPTTVITASPQRPDVTYNWNTIDGSFVLGANPWEIIVSKVGTYNVEVIFETGCPAQVVSTVITQDSSKPSFNGPPSTSSSASCNGNDGSITVSASGGTPPYSYTWTRNGNPFIVTSIPTINGLAPGTYGVEVKGVYACVVSAVVNVPGRVPVNIVPTITNVDCNGAATGAIILDVSGGKTPLSYMWSSGNNSKDLINVGSGNYTLNITDADGCVTTGNYTITQPNALSASIVKTNDTNPDPLIGDGTVNLTVTGGTGTYSFSWVATETGTVPSGQASQEDLTLLDYGRYTVTVTDANLCTTTATVFIYEPEVCNDLIDNDGDGLNNCDDPDCKPAAPGNITAANPAICEGQTTTYSVPANPVYESYVWSVPASATINGAATGNSISVTWNSTAGGQICVNGKKFDCLSETACILVNVEAAPSKPGTIIIKNGNN